jgi:hypothetical protein
MEKSKLMETKKWETCEEQSEEMLIIFFDMELFTKNSSWQAKQSIPHVTLTFYSECMKVCEDFTLNFGNKRAGCCITTVDHSSCRSF